MFFRKRIFNSEPEPVVEAPKEIDVTRDMVEDFTKRFLNVTYRPAERSVKDDEVRIQNAFRAVGVRFNFDHMEKGIMYQYYFTLENPADIHKILSARSQEVFSYVFGTATSPLRREGSSIVLEVPGAADRCVKCSDILRNDEYYDSHSLKVAVGMDMKRNPVLMDLEDCPHVLVAGETGSGKSIFLHQMIISLLVNHRSDEVEFCMVDPKRTELSYYRPLKNVTIATNAYDALDMLAWLCGEMDARYEIISAAGCRDLASYNEKTDDFFPRKVVVIDEFSDLMGKEYRKETEGCIVRLAQLGRACGIHLIIATQRPDRTVVTGLIKDNIPVRICLKVSSGVNSRIILDRMGGEKLIGKGDLLYLHDGEMVHCQAGIVEENEINNAVAFAYERCKGVNVLEAVKGGGEVVEK